MKTVKYVLVMLMTAGLGIFASCSDNENSCTPLSITRISTVTDREQGLEVANLAQYIIVQGTGLDGVKSILVNDVPVDMSNAYTTANEITFPIPRVIPVEVNNLITLSTATESTTAPLSVFIPDLRVDGMYNEFTPAGGTMKIVGDFLIYMKLQQRVDNYSLAIKRWILYELCRILFILIYQKML